jgi:hypothetical protein
VYLRHFPGSALFPWPSDGGAAMSLSAREQQALNSIKITLAGSDPDLAALLAMFTQLASGEEMPAAEKIRAGSRSAIRRHASRVYRRLGFRLAAASLWLVISIVLICTALALSHGSSQHACPESWPAICVNSVPATGSRPAAHKRAASHSPQSAVLLVPGTGRSPLRQPAHLIQPESVIQPLRCRTGSKEVPPACLGSPATCASASPAGAVTWSQVMKLTCNRRVPADGFFHMT